MTGEAFTTQRSGTPEFFFQLLHRQLDWGNVMFGQNVKKLSASEFERRRSLPLGQSTLLEPSQYGRLPHFMGKLLGSYVDCFRGLFRQLHCDRSSHAINMRINIRIFKASGSFTSEAHFAYCRQVKSISQNISHFAQKSRFFTPADQPLLFCLRPPLPAVILSL
jgi:hypothetical protein